jgi:hypothetical protein
MEETTTPFTVSIEGAVGVGKSRFINFLKTNREMKGVVFQL